MIAALISLSLRHRMLVAALAAALLVYGGLVLSSLPVDVLPDLNRPTVTIFTEAHGLAPEDVETMVTTPIETALTGAKDVARVRSASTVGLSIVWVEFSWSADVMASRQVVAEKLQQVAPVLPEGMTPSLGPVSSLMGEVMLVGVTAATKDVDPVGMRRFADWTLRPRLMAVPGVSQVTVIGGERAQYQVLIRPDRLALYGVTLHDVREALIQSSANTTGGFVFEGATERLIRVMGRVGAAEEIARSVIPVRVASDHPALTVGDLAEVRVAGAPDKRGDAGINAKPAVILSIQKQPGVDTVALTRALDQELSAVRATLPPGLAIEADLFRQSRFIEAAVRNVTEALRDGGILVLLVLFVFLLNVRTTLITLTAIPLSFVVAGLVFKAMGLTINTMTLGGLAVAIGELVDDAIVDVENVFRRLRENARLAQPRPALDVVRDASCEIRSSIVFATVIVVLVFLPLFALQGIEGRIFAPLGVAYIVSILASLGVAVTVTPALCALLLPGVAARFGERGDGWLVRGLKAVHLWALDLALKARWVVLGGVGAVFVAALALVPLFGREFLPAFHEGSVTVSLLSAPGTSLAESNRVGAIAERLIAEIPEVRMVGRRTGRAELDDHAEGVHSSELEVDLADDGRDRDLVLAELRQRLSLLPGVVVNVGQPISHRIDHLLSGVRAQIAVKVFGNDLAELRRIAEEVRLAMADVPGVVDLQVEKQVMVPQLHVVLDRDRAARAGVMAGEVAEYVALALQGDRVGQVFAADGAVSDVVMRLDDRSRSDHEAIARIPVDTVRGETVPLGMIAQVEDAAGPNVIPRENARRRIVVSANVSGRDLVGVVDEIRASVAQKVSLPEGYAVSYGGQFEAQASASRLLAVLGAVSLIGIFAVLQTHLRSVVLSAQIMVGIPLALIGAVFGMWGMGASLSVASLVGFITLTGIAARNGIMMVSHYLHLMRHEGMAFDLALIRRGAQERLVPVLMTSLTALLALTPLLMASGDAGKEILHPVAVVIFFGLFSSTVLTLIVTPLLFWMFGRRAVGQLVFVHSHSGDLS